MKSWSYLGMLLMMLMFTACEHRELMDPNKGHYLRIYLDEEIKNVTTGFYNESYKRPEYKRPRAMRVILTEPESGRIMSEQYFQGLKMDERGYYFDGHIGAESGTYNLLVYNVGSAVTLIRDERNYYSIQAYTDPISDYLLQFLPASREEMDNQRMVYEPEHLFHTVGESLVIPNSVEVDTLKTESGDWFEAHSVVKSYYLQLRIKGVEWVTSAVSLLSGMAGSTMLHGHEQVVPNDSVNLFFAMNYTGVEQARDGNGSTAILYTTFSTFGKLSDLSSVLTLNFEFMKVDGSSQVEKLDITSMFDTPLVKNQQWILLEHEIVITPTGAGGGMIPGVEPWDDIKSEIEL